MKIDVVPLLSEIGAKSHVELAENAAYPEDGLVLGAPVEVAADLVNTGSTILINAEVKTKVESVCARCLNRFDLPLAFQFQEEYSSGGFSPPAKKREIELTKCDFIFKIDKDNTIDLSEVVRQNIITELPIKPLCENCKR